jgi:hypothetical protein
MPSLDRADAASAVYGHLCRAPGLTAGEIARALGWTGPLGGATTNYNSRRVRRALADLEAAERIRAERVASENGPGYRFLWWPI